MATKRKDITSAPRGQHRSLGANSDQSILETDVRSGFSVHVKEHVCPADDAKASGDLRQLLEGVGEGAVTPRRTDQTVSKEDLEMILTRAFDLPQPLSEPFGVAVLSSLAAHREPATFDDLYNFSVAECGVVITAPSARREIGRLIEGRYIEEVKDYHLWARSPGRQPKLFTIAKKGNAEVKRLAAYYRAVPARNTEAP